MGNFERMMESLRSMAEKNPHFVDPKEFSFDPSAMGLTKLEAAKKIVSGLPFGAKKDAIRRYRNVQKMFPENSFYSDTLKKMDVFRDQFREALDMLKRVPKKVLSSLEDIDIWPGASDPSLSWRGSYHIGDARSSKRPTIVMHQSSFEEGPWRLPDVFGHEIEHGIQEQLLHKRGYSFQEVYDFMQNQMEALAEYGAAMKQKRAPIWGYGEGQAKAFKEIPTRIRNVDYNTMRKLEELLANSALGPTLPKGGK